MTDQTFDLNAMLAQWGAEVDAGGGGNPDVLGLKPGDHALKFRMPKGMEWPGRFFATYEAMFAEGPKTYVLVPAVVVGSSVAGIADPTKIKYVRLTSFAFGLLRKTLAARWRLFDEIGVTMMLSITKPNEKKTDYALTVMPDQYDSSAAVYPEKSIEEAAADMADASARFSAKKEPEKPSVTAFG